MDIVQKLYDHAIKERVNFRPPTTSSNGELGIEFFFGGIRYFLNPLQGANTVLTPIESHRENLLDWVPPESRKELWVLLSDYVTGKVEQERKETLEKHKRETLRILKED